MKYIITETQYDSLRRRLHFTESLVSMINGIKSGINLLDVCDFDSFDEYLDAVFKRAVRHYIFWNLKKDIEKNRDYDKLEMNLKLIMKEKFGDKVKEHWNKKIKDC